MHRGFSTPETCTGKQTVTYPDRTGARVTRNIVITVTLVPPWIGGKANVINKKSDLEAMKDSWDPEKYRVWFFNACSSIACFDELRGGLLPDRMDRHNPDLFGTTQSVPIAAGLARVLANLEGILAADTMEGIVARMQAATVAAFRAALSAAGYSDDKINEALASHKGGMFLREGAGDNPVAP